MPPKNIKITTEKVLDPVIAERERREAERERRENQSKEQVISCYNKAIDYMLQNNYIQALTWFHKAQSHLLGDKGEYTFLINAKIKECTDAIKDIQYNDAISKFLEIYPSSYRLYIEKYDELARIFDSFDNYKDSASYQTKCLCIRTTIALNDKDETELKNAVNIINSQPNNIRNRSELISLCSKCQAELKRFEFIHSFDQLTSMLHSIININNIANKDNEQFLVSQITLALHLSSKLQTSANYPSNTVNEYLSKIQDIEAQLNVILQNIRARHIRAIAKTQIILFLFDFIYCIFRFSSNLNQYFETYCGISFIFVAASGVISCLTISSYYDIDADYFATNHKLYFYLALPITSFILWIITFISLVTFR